MNVGSKAISTINALPTFVVAVRHHTKFNNCEDCNNTSSLYMYVCGDCARQERSISVPHIESIYCSSPGSQLNVVVGSKVMSA